MIKIQVKEEDQGKRLDFYLSEQLEDFSRSSLKRAIESGEVRLNGSVVGKANSKLRLNDVLEFDFKPIISDLIPHKADLDVVFEDNDILVINKPAGLIVHPTPGNVNKSVTLAHILLAYVGPSIAAVGHHLRPGIVQRLDKDTSGLMTVAKTPIAYLRLVEALSERTVKKNYIALVAGKLKSKEATIESPIVRSTQRNKMTIIDSKKAKNAITHYRVKEEYEASSLVDIDLETGRTHQIRVHFASIGHPLLGDALYGNKKLNDAFESRYGLTRQFLHSASLSFTHPITQKELSFEAPLSSDLQTVIAQLN